MAAIVNGMKVVWDEVGRSFICAGHGCIFTTSIAGTPPSIEVEVRNKDGRIFAVLDHPTPGWPDVVPTEAEIATSFSEQLIAAINQDTFDVEFYDVRIYATDDGSRFVKTVHEKGQSKRRSTVQEADSTGNLSYLDLGRVAAGELWLSKYGEPMPWAVDFNWAENVIAGAFPYEGPTKLTDEEWSLVCSLGESITLDMLWFVVEVMGWRPGKPVPKDSIGWNEVREREGVYGVGYEAAIEDLLGMQRN